MKEENNKRHGFRFWFFLSISVLIMLTGCAGREEPSEKPSREEGAQIFPEEWKKNGFQDKGQNPFQVVLTDTTMTPYHIVNYSEVVLDSPDFNVSYERMTYDCSDESAFYIKSYRTEDGWKYYLQQYDIRKEELSSDLNVFQEEGLQGYFDTLCLIGEKELASIFVSMNEKGKPQELRLITFDRSGEQVRNVLLDYEYRVPTSGQMMAMQSFLCDGNYFYLINYQESGLLVFDREGKEVCRDMRSDSGGTYYTTACCAPDGSVIASIADRGNGKTDLFYLQGTEEKRLGEIPGTSHRKLAMDGNGSFYYFESDRLIEWDTSTGEKTILLDNNVIGVDEIWLSAVTFSDNGRILLHSWSREEDYKLEIQTCSEEEVGTGDQMVFAVVKEYSDPYSRELSAEYSKKHPQNQITYETHTGDLDTYRTRVMADILSGGGPDLLLVSNEDARNLYENGALLDLMEYMDPKLKENLFPSVLARGTVDGKLIGLNPNMQGYALLVSNVLWEGDSWTIEDVVRLVDERKPQYLYSGAQPYGSIEPNLLLSYLFTDCPEKSPFLDLEAGICDFENKTFIRLLEICKEYGEKPALEEDQFYEMLRTGDCLFTRVSIMNMQLFSREIKPLEKICHFVGIPGQEGYGMSFSSSMYVVNANTKHKEAVLDCLWSLFSVKSQQKMIAYGPVREDMVRESVQEKGTNMLTSGNPGFDTGEGGVLVLEAREDGKSFVEEFVTALKGLEAQDSRSDAVVDIVESEADLYFEGVRTAEQTAEIIQNRVQLYLNENR